MLEEIRIRSLGVINDAVLELSPGLNVLTGETGAGKTMIITALSLVLGGKTDSALVRTGAERAAVAARIQLKEGHPARQIAMAAGAEIEEESAILARSVNNQGRTRALISGTPVNASTLAEMAVEVITIHAQSANARLLKASAQRDILDQFGGTELLGDLSQYQRAYSSYRDAESALIRARELGALADREVLEFQALVDDVQRVAPQAGELDQIANEVARLEYVDELREAAHIAHHELAGGESEEPGALPLLGSVHRILEKVQAKDLELKALFDRLTEPLILLKEIASEIASYESSLDADPARLEFLHERKASLTALLRRYGLSAISEDDPLAEIAERAKNAASILLGRENLEAQIQEATSGLMLRREELVAAAIKLTTTRRTVATEVARLVTSKIRELAMPNAEFAIAIEPRRLEGGLQIAGESVAFSNLGVDEVEMLLSAHTGGTPVPLAKGASGGELSRVMLAIEVVLARTSSVDTFIFDEVDAGVGGKAAIEVGRQLAQLAGNSQVIVVTHLAQVAAFADAHYTVTKSEEGLVSESDVRRLTDSERVVELARMLAGQEQSASARKHAEELLEMARRG
jgi:DNA repair protein RecN (Recombination protein N)